MYPILALVLANMIWGAAAPIFKLALTDVPPFTFAFLRFCIAAIIFFPFVYKKFRVTRLNLIDLFEIFFASVFGFGLGISFFFLGLQNGQSINASIIGLAGPVIVYLGSIYFIHEKFKKEVLLGLMLSLFGAIIIIVGPILRRGVEMGALSFESNIYFLISTITGSMLPLLLKNVLKKLDTYIVSFLTFGIAALIFLPLYYYEFQVEGLTMVWTMKSFLGLFFGAFFSSGIAYVLYYYGMKKINLQEVGLFSAIPPISTVIVAYFLVGEKPDLIFVTGAVIIFLGLYLSERKVFKHLKMERSHKKHY